MTESKGERYHQLSPGKQLKKQMNKTSTATVGGGRGKSKPQIAKYIKCPLFKEKLLNNRKI